jgi:hypothetical protein
MEQGLEAPLRRREGCGKPRIEQRRGKGEGARNAVNGRAGNSRTGDAGPRQTGFVPNGTSGFRLSSLSAEGKLRRAGTHRGKVRFATNGNVMNPRIGSGLKMVAGSWRRKPSRW